MSLKVFLSLPLALAISVYGAFQLQPVLAQSTGGVLQIVPPAPDRDLVPNRVVFSTVNEEVRAAKTLRLQNTGSGTLTITDLSLGNSRETANAIRTSDHQRAVDYSILNPPTLPLTLAAGAFIDLPIQFAPQRVATVNTAITFSSPHTINGENYAALTITSNDPARPTTVVNLAGINFADYEGVSEPSVAEIARTFGWTLNIGTENSPLACSNPTSCSTATVNTGGEKKLFGDEVYSPTWLRADASRPVLLWPLATISGRTDAPHSPTRWVPQGSTGQGTLLYNFAGRDNDDNVIGSNDLSGGENQKILPKILVNNVNSTPTAGTVDFIPSTSFGLNANGAFSDDSRNGEGDLHNFRVFPVRDQRGTLVPNSWFIT
ncbi:MAG: hypothetical protein H7Y22_08665, partial [Gemmatimonadaceae bacterium]|nr:hypothetical protein [Gloeobacterales cyanobacterium ES-bin-141]